MRERHKNFLTFLVALVLSYTALEFAVWRPFLEEVPLTLHTTLGRLQYLAQTSKADVIPKDYTLIIGDSLAEGLGDQLLQVIHERKPKYNTAHYLHDATGRDVLTFGVRGGYPSDTYVFNTYRNWGGINVYAGIELDQPKDVVVLYSGATDINDEMTNINFWLPKNFDRTRLKDPKYIAEHMAARAEVGRKAAKRRWHVFRNAHMLDTITKLTKLLYKNVKKGADVLLTDEDPAFRVGKAYVPNWSRHKGSPVKIRVGGETKTYPQNTVEALAFHSAEEIEQASLFFDASLVELKKLFPQSRLWVVYTPTPINAYHLESPTVMLRDRIRFADTEKAGPLTEFSAQHLARQSDRICRRIRAGTLASGGRFIDSRPHLRDVSSRIGYVHGPNDAGHFNKRGYTALSEIIRRGMKDGAFDTCANLAAPGGDGAGRQ